MSSSQLSSKSAPVQRNVTDTDTEPTSAPAQNTTNTNNASRNRFPSTQFSSIRSNHNPTIYPFSRVNPEGKSISSPLIVATSSNTTNSTANSAGNGRESVAVPPSFQDAAATAATDASETNKGQRNKKPPSQQQHHQHHSLLPSRVKFCQWNVIGCINCRSPPSHSLPSLPLDSDDQPPRKKQGPLLLELRQLTTFHNPTTTNNYNHPDSHAPNVATGLFANTVLCQSRGNPSLGASVTSTCLDFMSSDSSNLSLLPPPCATGLTSGALCIHTFAAATTTNELASPTAAAVDPSSRVLLSPWLSPTVDYYHMPRHQRPASAVAWRSNHRSHVAIGYGQSGTQASVSTTASTASGGGSNNNNNPLDRSRRLLSNTTASGLNAAGPTSAAAAANASSGGGDREYCCFLWDVEHQAQPQQQPHSTTLGSSNNNVRGQTSPLYKLSHAAGVASLGWILENGQTLVVGGQHRYLQLYDLRNASTTAPPVATVLSHTLGVHAIEVDPTRPSFFATYSRTAVGEPIKLWDARHLESPWSEIKIGGFTALTAVANSVQWSTLHPGILSVAVGDILQEYDTVSSTSRPILVNSVKMPKPILDFAHYPFDKLKDSVTRCGTRDAEQEVFAELFPKRIVAVDCDLSINAIAAHRIAPLAVSHRTGQVINSLNRTMLTSCPNPIATERSGIQSEEDISATMLRRARCHNITKYSMKTSSNIAIISKELKEVQSSKALIASSKTTEELLRLWKWIHRAESLCNETADDAIDVVSKGWSAKGLIDSGVWTLLESDDKTTEQKTMSDSLSCVTYDSSGRRYVSCIGCVGLC